MDPSVVRIVWAILILPTGFLAVLVYVVMALVVPDEDEVFRDPPMSAGTGVPGWPSPSPFPQQPSTGSTTTGCVIGRGAGDRRHRQGSSRRPPAQPPPGPDQRRARRHAERAERRSRRPGSASFIVGGSLIVLGSWFLMREYMPALDLSRFWPVAVVGFGILLVLLALSQRSDDRGGDQR